MSVFPSLHACWGPDDISASYNKVSFKRMYMCTSRKMCVWYAAWSSKINISTALSTWFIGVLVSVSVCSGYNSDYNFYLFCLLYVLIYLSSPVKSFHLVQSTVCNFLSKLTFTYLTVAFTWYVLKIGCDYSSLMVEYRSFSEYFAHRR